MVEDCTCGLDPETEQSYGRECRKSMCFYRTSHVSQLMSFHLTLLMCFISFLDIISHAECNKMVIYYQNMDFFAFFEILM